MLGLLLVSLVIVSVNCHLHTLGCTFQHISLTKDLKNENKEMVLSEEFFQCAKDKQSCSYVLHDQSKNTFKTAKTEDLDGISQQTVRWKKVAKEYGQWMTGDGIGGSEEKIGIVSDEDECYTICLFRKRNGSSSNGATVDSAKGRICYCEYCMTGRDGVTMWKSTYLQRS